MTTLLVRPSSRKLDRHERRFGEGLFPAEDDAPPAAPARQPIPANVPDRERRPAKPPVRRDDSPSDADRAWTLGYELTMQGVSALPPTHWAEVLRDNFFEGASVASAEIDNHDRERTHSFETGRMMDEVEAVAELVACPWED